MCIPTPTLAKYKTILKVLISYNIILRNCTDATNIAEQEVTLEADGSKTKGRAICFKKPGLLLKGRLKIIYIHSHSEVGERYLDV